MFALQSGDSRIDPNEIHDVLRNDRRRWTLQYLKQRLEPVEVRELSERVAELEIGESPAPRDLRQSVYNALNQTHLPKLDEVGLVDFDKDRKRVSLCERAREVAIYMDVNTPFGVTWGTYYRTIGVVALAAVVAVDTNVAFFSGVEPLLIATAFLFLFLFSTVYQLWSLRYFYLQFLFSDG